MSEHGEILECPACGMTSHFLIDWEYSGLDDSVFNYTATYYQCPDCGLAYVSNISDEVLSVFYANECSYHEKSHFDIVAPENIQKYEIYKKIIIEAGLTGITVTDIGCGRGGFLLWLDQTNWNANLQGVDIDLKSIPDTGAKSNKLTGNVTFIEGKALSLPFTAESQSFLTYFHVLEHVRDVDKLLGEAFRVLKDDGYIMIEVPDAENYNHYPIGSAFWLGIREHVNHFSPKSIIDALNRRGFEVISTNRMQLPTPEFLYPSLTILARKGLSHYEPTSSGNMPISSFIKKSRGDIISQSHELLEFCSRFSSTTFWGCSSELFSLMPVLNMHDFNICDSSRIKQNCHYRGTPVKDPSAIEKTGALIIAPYLHGDTIERSALELGWPVDSIYRLS